MSREHTHHFVTTKEIGQYLKLTPATVINLTIKGILPGFKIGKSWRFVIDEVMAAINSSKDNGCSSNQN